MATKRKSDVMELPEEQTELAPVSKKARVSKGAASSSSSASKDKTSVAKPQTWQDIKLPGEDEASYHSNQLSGSEGVPI